METSLLSSPHLSFLLHFFPLLLYSLLSLTAFPSSFIFPFSPLLSTPLLFSSPIFLLSSPLIFPLYSFTLPSSPLSSIIIHSINARSSLTALSTLPARRSVEFRNIFRKSRWCVIVLGRSDLDSFFFWCIRQSREYDLDNQHAFCITKHWSGIK